LEIAGFERHISLEIRQFGLVFFFARHFFKILRGIFVIVAFISHETHIIVGLRTVILRIDDFVEIRRRFFFLACAEVSVAFLEVEFVEFFIAQRILIDFVKPIQGLREFALFEIEMRHLNISLILLWACWIISNEIFHQFIGAELVQMDGTNRDIISAVGLLVDVFGFGFYFLE